MSFFQTKIFLDTIMVHGFWHICHSNMCARNAVRGSRMQDLWQSIVMKVHKLKEMGPPLHRYSNSSTKKIPIELKSIKKQPRYGEASFQAPRQAFCDPISRKVLSSRPNSSALNIFSSNTLMPSRPEGQPPKNPWINIKPSQIPSKIRYKYSRLCRRGSGCYSCFYVVELYVTLNIV